MILCLNDRPTIAVWCSHQDWVTLDKDRGAAATQCYLMKRKGQFPSAFRGFIRDVGAPLSLIVDNAKEANSEDVKRICNLLNSEDYYPNQDPAERRIGDSKSIVVRIMRKSGAPLKYWCYCVEYMEKLFNVYARKKQKWSNTFTSQWGETKDISVFRFYFFQLVRYLDPSSPILGTKCSQGIFWASPNQSVMSLRSMSLQTMMINERTRLLRAA